MTDINNIHNISFGTGHSIYVNRIIPKIETAQHEVVLVTCFWARSATLTALNDALVCLSSKAIANGTKIRVSICFSSSSLWQKLFHTASISGRTWTPRESHRVLGLPDPGQLTGLDMRVKSIFFLPFSVMHPKFVIIDRDYVLLPSCNVSFENWFEGCIELSGRITDDFVQFWLSFWRNGDRTLSEVHQHGVGNQATTAPSTIYGPRLLGHRDMQMKSPFMTGSFLLSPHHRNPRFTLPWQAAPQPPQTPRNEFLLTQIRNSNHSIYIQTPNLTARAVIGELFEASKRGVDVTILTSRRLMVLEQLVTSGTTTEYCVGKLVRRHKKLGRRKPEPSSEDLEANLRPAGRLRVSYFKPIDGSNSSLDCSEPMQSHLKLTIVDEQWTVFGSGNMDRASWFTSQELDVALLDRVLARSTRFCVDELMNSRSECVYDSG